MKTRFLPLSSLFLTFLTFCTILSASAQVPSYVPTNGLVGYWPFNGNANDESGNGNNGTVNGGISNATDRFGADNSAYLFNGIDSYISVPSLNSFSYTPVSYSAWVIVNSYFPNSFGHKFRSIIGRNTEFIIENGVIGFYADNNANGGQFDNNFLMWRGGGTNGDVPFSNSIPDLNTWIHVLYSQDIGGNWSWYINGSLTNSGNFSSIQNDYNFFQIGGCNNGGGYFWNDKLDDIGIWNRALTADEVLALYEGCASFATSAITGSLTPTQFTQNTYTCDNTVGSSYNWTVTNGVIVSGQGTNSIDVMWANAGVGSVSVVETNSTNCSGDPVILDVVIIPTSVEEFSSSFSLFPNPATTEINLQGKSEMIGSDFAIYDALGKVVLRDKILSTNQNISVINLSNGNYILRVGELNKVFTISK